MKKITFLLAFFLVFFAWNLNAQITSYPYLEDFESGDGGWTVDDPSAGSWELGTPANTIINSADSGANAWVTSLTGAYAANEDASVVSPIFDFSSLSAPSIEFKIWWNAEFSWDGMVLQSSIDDGTSWQNVGGLGDPNNWFNDGTIGGNPGGQAVGWTGRASSNNGSNGWVTARHALTGLAGQSSVLLRFAFASDGSVQDEGVGFDTVNIFEVTCLEPSGITISNITDITADITWTPGGTETDWEVVVQTAGTGAPTGSGLATTANNPYSVSGLTAITDYEVYVRSDCNGEFSPWVGPINFRTFNTPPPAPVGVTCSSGSSSFIYTAEYDSVDGWSGDINGGDGTWEIPNDSGSGGTGADAAFSGGSFMNYESSGGTTATASAVSPAIDLTTA
ncbi:fibronectin type III domain-containing protein, partial [Psychroserpens mesophilus]|uniref:fibronectin type III domain-containing protein n=1 Tax=Psychroserpens mesophilus TaxID=325473 RepID=UPI00058EA140